MCETVPSGGHVIFLSTLSLRRATMIQQPKIKINPTFLSTLSLRRATKVVEPGLANKLNFYPRSPCGERPWVRGSRVTYVEISIHALLAESDSLGYVRGCFFCVFLSTLSLRRATVASSTVTVILRISIHALLAESDLTKKSIASTNKISIHALLAESDTRTQSASLSA